MAIRPASSMSAQCRGTPTRFEGVGLHNTQLTQSTNDERSREGYVFGGLLAEMGASCPTSTRQRFNSRAGGEVGEVQKSVAQIRIKTLMVEKPPWVGRRMWQGLKAVFERV